MPFIAAIGTYLPCSGCDVHRIVGDDEDAITLLVEAGRPAGLHATGASSGLFALSHLADTETAGLPAAYERDLKARNRWEAGEFADSEQLNFPPRYRVADIGDRGRLVLCRVAVRSAVPDYGYAFQLEAEAA